MNAWNREISPFHPGEQKLQARLGKQEQMEQMGRRVIRSFLPQQHRRFYAELPYLFLGGVDAEDRPWATLLTGEPGFVHAPSDTRLRITHGAGSGHPLSNSFKEGKAVGLLGLNLANRRRNRVNGRITRVVTGDSDSEEFFELQVDQSFGNCPKYIRTREIKPGGAAPDRKLESPGKVENGNELNHTARKLIAEAETFFIATVNPLSGVTAGVDVSHRGGRPGFVRVEDNRVLRFPDFSGNGHFNTFGNLELCDRAGILFVDFEKGHLLHLTGRAYVQWGGKDVAGYAGAERLVRFELEHYQFRERALPFRFCAGNTSPFLDSTGVWENQ